MSLTNRVENILIAGLAIILTVLIFGLYNHLFVLRPLQNELNAQRAAIIELARQPKYQIDNNFDKMKSHKNGAIFLDLDNSLDTKQLDLIIMDSVSDKERKNIWEKMFFKKGKNTKN